MKNIFLSFLLLGLVAQQSPLAAEERDACTSAIDISDRSYLSVAIGTASDDPAYQLLEAL